MSRADFSSYNEFIELDSEIGPTPAWRLVGYLIYTVGAACSLTIYFIVGTAIG